MLYGISYQLTCTPSSDSVWRFRIKGGSKTPVLYLRRKITEIAIEAGQIALDLQATLSQLIIDQKGRLDFVTNADRQVEAAVVARIRTYLPDDGILGEEGHCSVGGTGRIWIIDPIDGTHNFLRGMSAWAVSIAVVQAGNPVAAVIHAPAHRITLAAEVGQGIWVNDEPYIRTENLEPSIAFTGVSSNISSTVDKWLIGFVRDTLGLAERRLGSATIMLIETILGRGDLYIGFGEHPWDVYGGAIIGQELQLAHSIVWPSEISNHEMVFVLGRPSLVEHTLAALRFNCLIHD